MGNLQLSTWLQFFPILTLPSCSSFTCIIQVYIPAVTCCLLYYLATNLVLYPGSSFYNILDGNRSHWREQTSMHIGIHSLLGKSLTPQAGMTGVTHTGESFIPLTSASQPNQEARLYCCKTAQVPSKKSRFYSAMAKQKEPLLQCYGETELTCTRRGLGTQNLPQNEPKTIDSVERGIGNGITWAYKVC